MGWPLSAESTSGWFKVGAVSTAAPPAEQEVKTRADSPALSRTAPSWESRPILPIFQGFSSRLKRYSGNPTVLIHKSWDCRFLREEESALLVFLFSFIKIYLFLISYTEGEDPAALTNLTQKSFFFSIKKFNNPKKLSETLLTWKHRPKTAENITDTTLAQLFLLHSDQPFLTNIDV